MSSPPAEHKVHMSKKLFGHEQSDVLNTDIAVGGPHSFLLILTPLLKEET